MFRTFISEQEKEQLLTGKGEPGAPTVNEPTHNVFAPKSKTILSSTASGGVQSSSPSGGKGVTWANPPTQPQPQKQHQYAIKVVRPIPMMNKNTEMQPLSTFRQPQQQVVPSSPSISSVSLPSQQIPLKPSNTETEHPYSYIRVMFMHQSDFSRTNFWNRCSERCTGSDIIHCEMNFPVSNESLSVDGAHPVFLEPNKNYSYNDWDVYSIQVKPEQYAIMYDWGKTQLGKPFDMGAYRCYLCSGMCSSPGTEPQAWLCSRLTVAILKRGGVLPAYVNEYTVSPDTLKMILLRMNMLGEINLQQLNFEVKKE